MDTHKSIFSERLLELMFQKEISSRRLSKKTGINDSTIRCWMSGRNNTRLANAIKLADYFKCSLDFMFGRSDEPLDFTLHAALPFYERLLFVLNDRNITVYRVWKDTTLSDRDFKEWRAGRDPLMQSVLDIANYLDVTLDYLVGRER